MPAHIESYGDILTVLDGDRTLAIVPGQHDAAMARYIAQQIVNSAIIWESFEELKRKAGGCPRVERVG